MVSDKPLKPGVLAEYNLLSGVIADCAKMCQ
jgi:hypothetical protein